MQEMILELMGEYGNLAVFLLILIENLFPPIPSEVILTFGGVMTTCTDMSVWGVIISATAGSLAGAVLLYYAGYLIPEKTLKKMVEGRVGSLLHFEPGDVDMAKGWFLKKGGSAVFLCRLIPIVRSLISIPAGISKMRMAPFLALTALGSFLWNTVLVLAGKAAGDSWEKISEISGVYSDLILIAAGTSIAFAVLFHRFKMDKKIE